MEKAREKLRDLSEGGNLSEGGVAEETVEPRWKKYARNRGQNKAKEEFATLVSSLLVIASTAWNVPETIKPSKDEITGISTHLTGIILRHVDISNAMTADVIDVIGILAISGAYFSRVGPELKSLRGGGAPGGGSGPRPNVEPPLGGSGVKVEVPLPRVPLSSDAQDFLNNIANRGPE